MTTFQRKPKIIKLVWENDDQELKGLVVMAKSMSLGSMLDLMPLIDKVEAATKADTSVDAEALRTVLTRFANCLVEWNYVDEDGQPVPATLEGLLGEDPSFVMEVVKAWADGLITVTGPLPNASGGTQPQSPEAASIPMESPGS